MAEQPLHAQVLRAYLDFERAQSNGDQQGMQTATQRVNDLEAAVNGQLQQSAETNRQVEGMGPVGQFMHGAAGALDDTGRAITQMLPGSTDKTEQDWWGPRDPLAPAVARTGPGAAGRMVTQAAELAPLSIGAGALAPAGILPQMAAQGAAGAIGVPATTPAEGSGADYWAQKGKQALYGGAGAAGATGVFMGVPRVASALASRFSADVPGLAPGATGAAGGARAAPEVPGGPPAGGPTVAPGTEVPGGAPSMPGTAPEGPGVLSEAAGRGAGSWEIPNGGTPPRPANLSPVATAAADAANQPGSALTAPGSSEQFLRQHGIWDSMLPADQDWVQQVERQRAGSTEPLDTSGIAAIEEGRRLQTSKLQGRLTQAGQAQDQALTGVLSSKLGGAHAADAGENLHAVLRQEFENREAAETAAWGKVRGGDTQADILPPAQSKQLIGGIVDAVKGAAVTDPKVVPVAQSFLEDVSRLAEQGDALSVNGIDALRKKINAYAASATNDTERRMIGAGRKAYETGLDAALQDTASSFPQAGVVPGTEGALSGTSYDLAGAQGAVADLRAAVRASAEKHALTDDQVRLPNGDYKDTELSKVVNGLLSGQQSGDSVVARLVSKNGNARQFLDRAEQVLPADSAQQLRETLKDSLVRRVIASNVKDVEGVVSMKSPGALRTLGNAIITGLDQNKGAFKALYSDNPAAVDELRTMGQSLLDMAHPENLRGSPSGSPLLGVLSTGAEHVPVVGKPLAKGLQWYQEHQVESALAKRIYLGGSISPQSESLQRVLRAIDDLASKPRPNVRAAATSAGARGALSVQGEN